MYCEGDGPNFEIPETIFSQWKRWQFIQDNKELNKNILIFKNIKLVLFSVLFLWRSSENLITKVINGLNFFSKGLQKHN